MATRVATNFKTREDVFSSITPPPWVQERIDLPHGEWRPAPWLPIVFTKSDRDQGADAFVISSGKVVALDRQGFIVPAGLRKWASPAATSTVVLTYTSTDYTYKVIDLTTGLPYATNGTTTYTALQVANALLERGLVPEDVSAAVPATNTTHIGTILNAFISRPVGVILYDVLTWGGLAEEGNQAFTNYNKQHAVQFTTEHQMKVPHRVATDVTDDDFDASAITTVTAASAAGDFPEAGEVWEIDGLVDLARYDLDGTEEIVAIALTNKPVAKNTTRTPISADVTGVLVKEKKALANVKVAGDWFLDEEVGLIFIHADTWATLVSDSATVTFSYSYYNDAGIGASSEHFVYFDGEGVPGDLLSIDAKSNFVRKGSSGDILATADAPVGRFYYTLREPRHLMDKVKSAFSLSNMNAAAKMPGTATGGYSDMITLAEETVADRIVVLSVRI